MSALTVEGATKRFGKFTAIENVSFAVEPGEFVTLLGPSGCGKTTLLKSIAGFYKLDSGVIAINGRDVTDTPPERRDTTMCFQSYALFPHLSVAENIVFGLRQKRVPVAARNEILARVADQVDLTSQLKKMPQKLSGGQQQRVALARALAMRTGVILFDEPLSNLDAKLREQVRFEILALQKEHGFTAIYVTHDQSEALAMSDQILVMNGGEIRQRGTPEEIYRNPADSFVAGFIGTANILDAAVVGAVADETYRVSTAMGELVVTSPEPPPGERVKVCWRPEAARIVTSKTGENSFTATVAIAVYQGNLLDIVARDAGADNGAGSCRLQVFHRDRITEGSAIRFHVPPQDITFLEAFVKHSHALKVAVLLAPGLGLIVIFVGIVVAMAVIQSFGFFNFAGDSAFSLRFWEAQLSSRQFWTAVLYSSRVAVLGAVFSVLLAYPIALWLRKPFPGSGLISALIKIPLLVPGLVAAFLYVNLISYSGFLNYALTALGFLDEPARMQNDPGGIGVIILQTWKNMPFALLLLVGAVQSISDDVLDAAQDLGAPVFARFRKVVAPLTLRSLQVSLVIIFIGAAGDFSFQVIAGPVNVSSMAQLMYRLQTQAGSWNASAVVAVSLMLVSLLGATLLALVSRMIVKVGQQ